MAVPRLLRVLNKGIIAGVVGTAISFFAPLVPCTKAATETVAQNASSSFGMCTLPAPFGSKAIEVSQKYYGISTNSLSGLVLQFLIITGIVTILFMLVRRKAGNVLDLTHK